MQAYMKANMIANMQMAMAGTKKKKKSAARKTKLKKKILRFARRANRAMKANVKA